MWTHDIDQSAYTTFSLVNKGTNLLVAGDLVVAFSDREATAFNLTTGKPAWSTQLPQFLCATSPTANRSGVIAILMGRNENCSQAAALDTSTGKLRWTAPIPPTEDSIGHQVAVGADTVVVTGECFGFSILSISDGTTIARVPGHNSRLSCATAASDGTSVVLSSAGTLSTYNAATGNRQHTWPAPRAGRLGDILTQDPLVVTGSFDSARTPGRTEERLVDLSAAEFRLFGRGDGSIAGQPASSARLGDTLWVSAETSNRLVGYDLKTLQQVGAINIGSSAALIGSHANQLVISVDGIAPYTFQLQLIDPTTPDTRQVVGILPLPRGELGAKHVTTVVAGDQLLRLWTLTVEAFSLR